MTERFVKYFWADHSLHFYQTSTKEHFLVENFVGLQYHVFRSVSDFRNGKAVASFTTENELDEWLNANNLTG